MHRKTGKRLFVAAIVLLASLLAVIILVFIHSRLFPFALESAVRQYIFSRYVIRPVVADAWGALLTRVQPLDEDHVIIGKATSLITLKRNDRGYSACSEVKGIGIIHDFALRGDVLYAAKGNESLAWYDVKDPCSPRPLGKYLFGGYGFGLEIVSDRLFLANRGGGLVVFRLKESGKPVFESVRYGSTWTLNDQSSPWMTSDVDSIGDWLVAADGNHGVLVFGPEGRIDAGIRTFFTDELAQPSKGRNIDPAPLRVGIYADNIYLAMRERGLAVLEHVGGGELKLKNMVRPDGDEVLDLAVSGNRLFVPSTSGNVYAFDLSSDPEIGSDPAARYSLEGKKAIHSLAVKMPYLYVVAVGSGLYVFHVDHPDLVFRWRTPDEFRGIAKIGERFVAALGSGGFGVFEYDSDRLRMTGRWQLPSFVFETLNMGEDHFGVCADLAGTLVYCFNEQGNPTEILHIPTPEHVFSGAFIPPDRFATANGVYGVLRYEVKLQGEDASYKLMEDPMPEGGYFMHVDAWQDGFVGENIAGGLHMREVPHPESRKGLPSRCLRGAVSGDGRVFAVACGGNEVFVFSNESEGLSKPLAFSYKKDVASLLPSPPYLLVGGFPNGLSVLSMDGNGFHSLAEFDTQGTPYDIIQDGNRYWIAAGREGIRLLSEEQGNWRMKKIIIDGRSDIHSGEAALSE